MLSHYLVDYISLIIYEKSNLIFFFSHKNQLYPPALSDHNNRELGKKIRLDWVHETWFFTEFIVFDCKILDGMTPFHLLNPLSTNRFIGHIENVFICHIKKELECCYRIDIVWDQYFSHSKESTTKKARYWCKKKVNQNQNDQLIG